jgi:hypothetical protein
MLNAAKVRVPPGVPPSGLSFLRSKVLGSNPRGNTDMCIAPLAFLSYREVLPQLQLFYALFSDYMVGEMQADYSR